MKKSLHIPFAILLSTVIGLTLPLAANAKGRRGGGNNDKMPDVRDQEATISAVTATSITITSSHVDTQKVRDSLQKNNSNNGNYGNNGNNGNNNGGGKKNQSAAIAAATTTKNVTYQISELTDIEVNGETANASALKVGMAVSISADPPLSLSAPDPTDGGVARNITAHDAPTGGGATTATTAQ